MFFRKLSQSGNSSSNPPEYTENDYLNHQPFISPLRTSDLGPQIAPLNENNPSKGKTVLKTLKDVQKLGTVPFYYNVFDEALNPPTQLHDCKSLRLELALDTDTVYLPGLFEQQGSSSDCPLALLTGKVIVTVKATSCVMQDFKIKLNGYSTEFVCTMKQKHLKDGSISDPNSEAELDFVTGVDGHPQLKLLKDNANGSLSYLKPFVTDEISAFDTYPMVLTQGTYIIPFSFELDPIKHHSSFKSLFGSTTYRVETLLRVMQPSKGIISGIPTDSGDSKNYFLSQKCFITKTLSPSDVLKYESVSSQGTFDNGLIDYGFCISTKLIEFDSPFHCHFSCMGKPDIKIFKVNVSLLQTCNLPCIKPDGITAAKRSYSSTNTYRLAEYVVPPDEQTNIITTKFEDLKIATRSNCNLFTSKILPYYNEVSRLETVDGEKVMKMSITHHLKIVVTIIPSGSDSRSKNFININFKIPIEVIDKNISSSLYLPAYKSPSPAIPGNGPFTADEEEYNSYSSPISLSSADSPPAYSSLCH